MNNAPKIYILAGDVSFNRGDLASVYAHIVQIRKIYPQADITFCALKPEKHQNLFDAKLIKRSIFINPKQFKGIKNADIVIWGGGAFIADHSCATLIPYWFVMIFITRFILRKKVIAVSHGVVLKTKLGRFLAKIIYGWVEVIAARDSSSLATIKGLGVKTPVIQAADFAVLLEPDAKLKPEMAAELKTGRKVFAISLTFWHLYNSTKDFLPYYYRKKLGLYKCRNDEDFAKLKHGLAALSTELIRRYDCDIRFIPRYPDKKWDDIEHIKDIKAATSHPERVHILTSEFIHPAQYPRVLGAHEFSIAIPLHDVIFLTLVGAPFISLNYETKGNDFMKMLDAGNRYSNWQLLFSQEGIEEVCRMVQKTLENWEEEKRKEEQNLPQIQARAMINIELLQKYLQEA